MYRILVKAANYCFVFKLECWETVDLQDSMPVNAVPAGHDTDGDPIYVGRASHNGELLPAKVIPNKQTAYVSASGLEHHKQDAEVLTQYPQQYGKSFLTKKQPTRPILLLYLSLYRLRRE